MKDWQRSLMLLACAGSIMISSLAQSASGPYQVAQSVLEATGSSIQLAAASETKPSLQPAGDATNKKIFTVHIANEQPVKLSVFRLSKGDKAAFSVQVPYDGALAMHGYTKDMTVVANKVMTFDLIAKHTGRFPIHIHTNDGRHVEVGVLEVMPR